MKLAVLLSVTVAYLSLERLYLNFSARPNYLYQNSSSLSDHLISKRYFKGPTKIIFLGSSAVSGSNIPPQTTLSDYFNAETKQSESYNLAVLEASILESLVYLNWSLPYKPQYVIYGISPDNFPASPESTVIFENLTELRPFLKEPVYKSLTQTARRQGLPLTKFKNWLSTKRISPAQATVMTWLEDLRIEIFGDVYSKQLHGKGNYNLSYLLTDSNSTPQLLVAMNKLCRLHQVKMVTYFVPFYKGTGPYQANEFLAYKQKVLSLLAANHIPNFDYSSLLVDIPQNFVDFTHLTPQGNALVASQLHKDLEEQLNVKL